MEFIQNPWKQGNVGPCCIEWVGITSIRLLGMLIDNNYAGGCFWAVLGNLPLVESLGIRFFEWSKKFTSIGAISIYQKNPDLIWVGNWWAESENSLTMGGEVYRSLDGRKNWGIWGDWKKTKAIHRIIIHPEDPNTVFVGAIGCPLGRAKKDRGVYKTYRWRENLEEDSIRRCQNSVVVRWSWILIILIKSFVNIVAASSYPTFLNQGRTFFRIYLTLWMVWKLEKARRIKKRNP